MLGGVLSTAIIIDHIHTLHSEAVICQVVIELIDDEFAEYQLFKTIYTMCDELVGVILRKLLTGQGVLFKLEFNRRKVAYSFSRDTSLGDPSGNRFGFIAILD